MEFWGGFFRNQHASLTAGSWHADLLWSCEGAPDHATHFRSCVSGSSHLGRYGPGRGGKLAASQPGYLLGTHL